MAKLYLTFLVRRSVNQKKFERNENPSKTGIQIEMAKTPILEIKKTN